ncbi:type IX secretion system periplasmic lipoprotein PorW/SprE [Jiulongibacter sp. NS-SX5]|uniref:type IX secretion system periplasmic lipoprotein PorW/SprE n=1 Tax=Jiulongibacter sp. NS-SX5 TaxID=3463854 RepID=UPI004059C0EB
MIKKLLILVLGILVASCSQFSNSPTSKAWHNLNAKYNASIDAKDYYDYAIHKIDSSQIEDYSRTLPILHKIDSNHTVISKAELDEVIRLTSLVAERHSNSKHLDKAYLTLGKARVFKEDFYNAIEVFKYLNSNHKNEEYRDAGLIWLMRAYMENDEFNKAEAVAQEISQLNLSKANKADFYQIKGAYHQRKGETALAAVFLEEALKHMKKSTKKARGHFIAGQLFKELGKGSLARENWKKVVKNKPTYELEFNSGIALLLQASDLGANANASFAKMLEDRKNTDLKDKIYFKMAEAKAESGNYREAIKDFSTSVALAEDRNQKANAYLQIAEIYYGPLANYSSAAVYYDSTLQHMSRTFPNYEAVEDKSKSLTRFVSYQKVLRTEDSLQQLAQMNPLALEDKIEQMIKAEQAKEKRLSEEAAALKKEEENRAVSGNNRNTNSDGWLFYNQVRLTRARTEFIRKWGNRPLEDNWRRKEKEAGSISFKLEKGIVGVDDIEEDPGEIKRKEEEKRMAELETQKQAMISKIPTTPQQMAISRRKQEEAYYQLGKIYRLQFNEIENSKRTFAKLLSDFPNSQYEQEVLYFMALMAEDKNTNQWKSTLIEKYPFSGYARQLKRGEIEVTADTESNAARAYEDLYADYKKQNYQQALKKAETALYDYTGTSIEDKIAMLRIMLLAKTGNNNSYRIALMDFIRSYPSSNLKPRVSEMLAALTKK